ncbi:O-antigen ligase domain-containing protein [Komagataeibacter rhaeticus]|nr:O-antigen ligase domain-containing protein [Komagataeibacter rhaeticus]
MLCAGLADGARGMLHAAGFSRYFVFVAALQAWVLPCAAVRRVLARAYGLVALWLVAGCWQQYLCGRNFMGYGRWADGALLGPLWAPRAGHALVMTALPGLFPYLITLSERAGGYGRLKAAALLLGLVLTMVLVAQRMPLLHMLAAMGVVGLLVPRLRAGMLAVGVLGAGALPCRPAGAQAYDKLVVNLVTHLHDFADSPYGMLFIRAGVMIARHPWSGLGFDGFRHACPDPAYFHGLPWLGWRKARMAVPWGATCTRTISICSWARWGLPAMGLFAALAVCLLVPMWRGLVGAHDPCRLMLAITAALVLWPVQSTSSLLTQPTAGWMFMAIGWGLAAAPVASQLQFMRGRD